MAPKKNDKPAHVADQDDIFGPAARMRSACSASSVASGLQDLSLSSDRAQSPTPTAQAHNSTSMESTNINASNPSEPTACSRHGFKMAISYREVTEEDEVKDRRRRQRDQLLHEDAATRSHIYSVRHQSRQVDLAADARYLPAGEGALDNDVPVPQPQQHGASSLRQHLSIPEAGLHDAGTPPRTREAKLSSNVAKNKVIEAELLMAMRGRVNKKMLDIQPSSDMTPTERLRWNTVVKTLAHEMKTPGYHLYALTEKLKPIHRNNPSGEAVLSGEGAEFANIVTRRLAAAVGGRTKQRLTGIFKSAGNHDMKDGDIPRPGRSSIDTPENKIDIIVHGEHAEEDDDRQWEHALTFGEVKVEASWDLKDELLGQMLRYLRKILQNHPVSGRNVCFSLCGHLLRIFETDPVSISTSPAYSFRDPKDYEKIICAIALLSGPPCLVSEQWQPSPQEKLSVRKADGDLVEYRLKDIRRLAVSPVLWGSRTAAWAATAQRVDDNVDATLQQEALPLVIKSSWLPDRLYDHELDMIGRIDEARSKCISEGEVVPLLPFPVGHAINAIPGSEIRLDNWRTADGRTRNTTIITFCTEGKHVDEDLPTLRNHVRFHRSLTQTIRWLAKIGLHYRDLNNGNVLRSATGYCVLIDFGNARYLKRPRGQAGDQPVGALELSMDDARSGTLMFMSRRIHRLTIKRDTHMKDKRKYEQDCEKLAALDDDDPYRLIELKRCEDKKGKLEKQRQEMMNLHDRHCYVDDAESQLYLMMQQILYSSGGVSRFEAMEDLHQKELFWDDTDVPLNDAEIHNLDWRWFRTCAGEFRTAVNSALEEIKAGLDAGTLDISEGTALDCEIKCFDLLDEIWAREEARQDDFERKMSARMG